LRKVHSIAGHLVDMRMIGRPSIAGAEDRTRPKQQVAELQAALLDQREDRDRGERLGHAGDAEKIVGRRCFALLTVGPAVGLAVDELAGAANGDRQRRNLVPLHVRSREVGERAAFRWSGLGRLGGGRLAERAPRLGGRRACTQE
jgi:hypothetical protein